MNFLLRQTGDADELGARVRALDDGQAGRSEIEQRGEGRRGRVVQWGA